MAGRFDGCDPGIRYLLSVLALAGLESDWSCQGTPGHMCIRPYVQIRTRPGAQSKTSTYDLANLQYQRGQIEKVMDALGVEEYWLQLTYTYGKLNTHGGEPVWILQLPGRFDYIAHPVPYSVRYQDEAEGAERLADHPEITPEFMREALAEAE